MSAREHGTTPTYPPQTVHLMIASAFMVFLDSLRRTVTVTALPDTSAWRRQTATVRSSKSTQTLGTGSKSNGTSMERIIPTRLGFSTPRVIWLGYQALAGSAPRLIIRLI